MRIILVLFLLLSCASYQRDTDIIERKAELYDLLHTVEAKYRVKLFLDTDCVVVYYLDDKNHVMKQAVVPLRQVNIPK